MGEVTRTDHDEDRENEGGAGAPRDGPNHLAKRRFPKRCCDRRRTHHHLSPHDLNGWQRTARLADAPGLSDARRALLAVCLKSPHIGRESLSDA